MVSFSEVNSFSSSHRQIGLLHNFYLENGKTKINSLAEFQRFKQEVAKLENSWEYIIHAPRGIGLITLKNSYEQPQKIFTLTIEVPEVVLSRQVQDSLTQFLKSELSRHTIDFLLAYESKEYIIDFYHQIGGKSVNWLNFYEMNIDSLDYNLLEKWDNSALLDKHELHIENHDFIPEELISKHAKFHTLLSNAIRRLDYSWSVVKSVDYTSKRQALLRLQGKQSKHIYLFDRSNDLVGMTKLVFDPASPERIYQTITGIDKKYEGLGFAKLLKAKMLKRVMQEFPDVKIIETDCLKGNEPMISINKKLGFYRKSEPVEVEILLDDLLL